MDIMEMKKEDFKKVPFRDKNTDLSDFYSVVILPTEEMHGSGYMCMDFVAVNSDMHGRYRNEYIYEIVRGDDDGQP